SRRRHTRFSRDWSSDVCSSDLRKLRRVARDGLFTARNDEPAWSAAHNILAPAFTQTAMRSYHQTMAATIGELLDTWGDTHHIAEIGRASWRERERIHEDAGVMK